MIDARPVVAPGRHHLDRRADHLAREGAAAGDTDDLLDTKALAAWLGVSTQFLEIGRHRGYGPRFVRLSTRRTRYRRGDVIDWLRERTHAATAEYQRDRPPTPPRPVPRFVRRAP
jgi:predicted DNA-binding transcriptional regulator AlpA